MGNPSLRLSEVLYPLELRNKNMYSLFGESIKLYVSANEPANFSVIRSKPLLDKFTYD